MNEPGRAEPYVRRALVIFEKTNGPAHPQVAAVLENYAGVLERPGRVADAALQARVKTIFGPSAARH
jgi:hypothetical protein